ncbi:MAG: hypothetical protein Q9157_004495 [Trypethelium eluteriae]
MDRLKRKSEPLVHPRQIEEYLVEWKGLWTSGHIPHSWHTLEELEHCLNIVQAYLQKLITTSPPPPPKFKRKSSEDHTPRPSPSYRTNTSPSSASESIHPEDHHVRVARSHDVKCYNAILTAKDGWFEVTESSAANVPQIDSTAFPTTKMVEEAKVTRFTSATNKIRRELIDRLKRIRSSKEDAEVTMANTVDQDSPPLGFKFVDESILREGVIKLDDDTLEGCHKCRPDMGQNIGCEYTRWCACLEYARVDEERLDERTLALYLQWKETDEGDPYQFPKRFPYRIDKTHGLLLNGFYLDSRHTIYECNDRCRCGPRCKNRNVQWGRSVPLQIFKTKERGWGLRCPVDLRRGQFIDTYRGEIITSLEADRREKEAGFGKDSYLYSLDKFREEKDLQEHDMFLVDGQFMGGPTRFINHSCEPNCRQYAVSYNKHDFRVYDIAFFACQDIPKNTELTFDYMDKDEEDEDEDQHGSQRQANPNDVSEGGIKPVKCRCGSKKCRKWLWM